MLNKIQCFADDFDMFPGKGTVLVCVSGGADSMCLLEALLDISRLRGFTVSAAHFNHRLRGAESDRDEAFVRDQCVSRGITFYQGSGDVAAYAKEFGLSIESSARDLRYRFFHETAPGAGAVRIATAHTADDNAETMILNFTRGTGAAGMAGIPPTRGMIIRPMLRVTRAEVLAFIDERGIPYVSDSTNDLDVFSRNKVRRSVIPVLREINPGFGEVASTASELFRADEEYLSGVADSFISEHSIQQRPGRGGCGVSAVELQKQPFAISSRVVRKLYGGSLAYKHVKAILGLCAKSGPPSSLSLPDKTVYYEYGRLVFAGAAPAGCIEPVILKTGDCAEIPGAGLKITCKSVVCNDRINKSLTSFLFNSIDVCGKMTVRSRREGDVIRLFGRSGTKTLKKLFIEHRIPARERPLTPVIADEAGVLAVYGIGVGHRAAPRPGDAAFQIEFEETKL